ENLPREGAAARHAEGLRDEMSNEVSGSDDAALGRRLNSELPRYTAPAHLRVSIVQATDRPARRPAWLVPLIAAAATAMALVLFIRLPAERTFTMNERDRVAIAGRWRPMLKRDAGFVTWVWKQGDVACFLVSDMVSQDDLERFKDYFVRVRVATEPTIAY